MAYNKELGANGEKIAKEFLLKEGYTILESNFRCRLGEIDIIALEGEYLIFIEVKTRTGYLYGYPIEAINAKKKNSLVKVAQTYLALKKLKDKNLRFDVVEIIIKNKDSKAPEEIRLIKNAF